MASDKAETSFDLDNLIEEISGSFCTASENLRKKMESEDWKKQPFVYHMPNMHVSIHLELTHSSGKIKGVFRKRSSEQREELSSQIEIDVVAVPRIPERKEQT